jgi:hypothetical protein
MRIFMMEAYLLANRDALENIVVRKRDRRTFFLCQKNFENQISSTQVR